MPIDRTRSIYERMTSHDMVSPIYIWYDTNRADILMRVSIVNDEKPLSLTKATLT